MSRIKAIALYLPQFHRTKENDEWWGEGFTEWTAVKGSDPLFQDHNQPREPLHDNYYNLLEKSTMQWQVSLAKEADIFGFCFYHYWFKDGTRILEKPAENLLEWKDITMPFCFSWANESWARTWSKAHDTNVWSHKFENNSNKEIKQNSLLLEQRYGEEEEWQEHFEYLLPFFKDKRYIRMDGKPVFIIYNAELVLCLDRMLDFWIKLAKQSGLSGIYVIAANCKENKWKSVDARLIQEPRSAILEENQKNVKEHGEKKNIKTYSYDHLWKNILSRVYNNHEKIYLCGFVDYDDTPRHGIKGNVVSGVSSYKFYKYLKQLVIESVHRGNQLVFINAWNEWGEGMYLEPDKKHGYENLKAVKRAMTDSNNVKNKENNSRLKMITDLFRNKIRGITKGKKMIQAEDITKDKEIEKFKGYFYLFHQWLSLKEEGKSLEAYFRDRKINTIAIYGLGIMGNHLLEELKDSNIIIKYAIDKNADNLNSNIPILSLEEELPRVDAVIVTATFAYSEIYDKLSTLFECPIISLEEVINEC